MIYLFNVVILLIEAPGYYMYVIIIAHQGYVGRETVSEQIN